MSVFIIAEAGSSHDNDLQKAYRLIDAAKECGADAVKFQWTSSGEKLAFRRGLGAAASSMYSTFLEKPMGWICSLKVHADKVGIEFMVTTYLCEDIAVIAPLVKRFKISAFEATWDQFVSHHAPYERQTIISSNPGQYVNGFEGCKFLHCISEYPTPVDRLKLGLIRGQCNDGLSDHTTSTLTGALAVAAGATIIEKHIRLQSTFGDNPDYGHSLIADCSHLSAYCPELDWIGVGHFKEYVRNIREAERAM